jgi:hypothetical protein
MTTGRIRAHFLTAIAMIGATCVASVVSTSAPAQAAIPSVDIVGPAGSGRFGESLLVLPNGNFVVTDSGYDLPTATDVGAVYLFDGRTHQMISMLTGSTKDDRIGQFGAYVVGDSNFAVNSRNWDRPTLGGPIVDAGAVTWFSGTTGVNGVVSAANSLVGTTANEQVGLYVPTVLKNGNYIVLDNQWDSPSPVAADAGAVVWGDGNAGARGLITSANAMVGSTAGQNFGTSYTELTNGNFVARGRGVPSGVVSLTWMDGNTGTTTGVVGPGNTLSGASVDSPLGTVVALTNGNYVVLSPKWDLPAVTDAGAVTWGSGTSGVSGTPTAANSLVGVTPGDAVGSNGIIPLTNGNYVVLSPNWTLRQPVTVPQAGAATWRNGGSIVGGTGGTVGITNSLYGGRSEDHVGGGLANAALSDGRYVVGSPEWDPPLPSPASNVGAATWADGNGLNAAATVGGLIGQVSSTNSLLGSATDDRVGTAIRALTNGNYVVLSPRVHRFGMADAGAVTWGNGASGITGAVGVGNSLLGSPGDFLGQGTYVLENGNYVVATPNWDNNRGAVTLGNGATGTTGEVTNGNSLHGTQPNDRVGSGAGTSLPILPLPNGSYVVSSGAWHSATGAVTWRAGDDFVGAELSDSNSLVGAAPNNNIGYDGITVLPSGAYVVGSEFWSEPGGPFSRGASTWARGDGVTAGVIGPSNSLVGSSANDRVGLQFNTRVISDDIYVVVTPTWQNGLLPLAGAATIGGPAGVRGPINDSNSLLGQVASDIGLVGSGLTSDRSIVVGRPTRNRVTLITPDITPPVLTQPPNITVATQPGATSAVVTYETPTATEDVGTATVACTPPSGGAFSIGVTTVRCTATNGQALTTTVTFTVTVTATPGIDYVPLAPARLSDTRPSGVTIDGLSQAGGPTSANPLELSVAGRGGVPGDAVAATLNVTVTEAAAAGFVTVYPCGSERPTASNLNFGVGATIPNAVVTKIGVGGAVCLFASQPVHLVVDVNGYFPPTTSYVAANPARVLDTRAGHTTIDGAQQETGAVAAGSVTAIQITGRAGVPADATAVVLNATVTEPTAAGYATVFPCGTEPPTASNLNYTPGLTIPNLVIAKIGAGGTVCVFSQSPTHLVADVLGYFPAVTSYAALAPARLLDTREGQPTIDTVGSGAGVQPLGATAVVHVGGRGGVPGAAKTATLNVTVTEPHGNGYVTVYPCGIDPPLASNLSFVVGQTIANAVITAIGANGDVCLFTSQPTHLIADVTGYFP